MHKKCEKIAFPVSTECSSCHMLTSWIWICFTRINTEHIGRTCSLKPLKPEKLTIWQSLPPHCANPRVSYRDVLQWNGGSARKRWGRRIRHEWDSTQDYVVGQGCMAWIDVSYGNCFRKNVSLTNLFFVWLCMTGTCKNRNICGTESAK